MAEQLALPIVDTDARIDTALVTMRSSRKSGVVAQAGTHFALYTADELLDQLRERIEAKRPTRLPLLEFDPRLGRHLFPPAPLRAVRPGDPDSLKVWLEQSGHPYAVIGLAGGIAEVMTASRSLSEVLLRVPVICVCRSDPTHIFRPGEVAGHVCSIDGGHLDCG